MDQKQYTENPLLNEEVLFVNPLPSIPQKQPARSQMFGNYLNYLCLYLEDQNVRQLKRGELRNLINSEKLMLQTHWISNMKLKFLEESKNRDFVSLLVIYGYYRIIVNVVIKDEVSPIHTLCENSAGNFANIYRVNLFNTETAIKCHHFKKNNIGDDLQSFQAGFSRILKEYVIFVIASKLEAGPHLHSPCGFDLFVYRDCIEFMMEYCEQDLHLCPKIEAQLKESLRRLHSLNIIHFDIKTQNICYSHKYKKAVFIDFGLSEAVRESPGWKTLMPFRGSISYCSEEMVQCYNTRSMDVDAYYNDVACLEQSLKEISENKMPVFLHQELIPTNLSNCYIFDVVRFCLFDRDEQKLEDKCRFFKRFNRFLIKYYLQELRQELKQRPISSFSKYVWNYCYSLAKQKEMKFKQQLSNRWRSIMFLQNNQTTQIKTIQSNRSSFIKHLCEIQRLSKKEQITSILMKQSPASSLAQQSAQYILLLAQNIKIESNKFTYQEKQRFAAVLLRQSLEQKNPNDIQRCIEKIFDYVFEQNLSIVKLKILQQIIISVVIFETKLELQIIDSFNRVIDFNGDYEQKNRTIGRYLTAISWAKFKTISSYSFDNLQRQVFAGVKIFLNRNAAENKPKVKLLQYIQNLQLNTNIKKLIDQINRPQKTEEKFFRNMMMLDTFTSEQQVYQKYLQLSLRYPSTDSSEVVVEELQKTLFNYMQYEKNSFHFALLQLFKIYAKENNLIAEDYIFNKYHQFFHPYKFYQHFQIYISKNILNFLNHKFLLDQRNIKTNLINLSKLIQQFSFREKMKYNICLLQFLDYFKIHQVEVIDLLRIKKGFWKEQFYKQFKKIEQYSNQNHFSNKELKNCLHFILQQLEISSIAGMSKNEVIDELGQYYRVLVQQTLKINCYQCRLILLLQAKVVQIITLYLENRCSQAFHLAFQFMYATQKDAFLLTKHKYEEFIKYAEPSCELMLLYFEMARLSERIYLINYANLIAFFRSIYYELYKRSRFDDIFWLVDQVTSYLQTVVKQPIISLFVDRMKTMVQIVKRDRKDHDYFFESHLQLIQCWKQSTNPYLSLFFMIFLQSRTRKLKSCYIYRFIARALNNLDYFSKEIILNSYFGQFYANFSPMPLRRQRYLLKKHQKYQYQPLNLQQYLKINLSREYLKGMKFSRSAESIKMCIIRYYQNLEFLK